MDSQNHIHDLLPLYALGALSDSERAQVEAALQGNPALQAELDSYAGVMEGLALHVPQVAPPPDLEERLMQRIRARKGSPHSIWLNWRGYLTLAAALLLLLCAVLVWQLSNQPSSDPITRILNDARAQELTFTGSEDYPQIHGRLIIARDRSQAVLQVEELPPFENNDLQVWLAREDQPPLSAAVFTPRSDRENTLLIDLPSDFELYHYMGVSVEPRGGSPSPTGERVFGVPLQD